MTSRLFGMSGSLGTTRAGMVKGTVPIICGGGFETFDLFDWLVVAGGLVADVVVVLSKLCKRISNMSRLNQVG